jgi:hypothetical protein
MPVRLYFVILEMGILDIASVWHRVIRWHSMGGLLNDIMHFDDDIPSRVSRCSRRHGFEFAGVFQLESSIQSD